MEVEEDADGPADLKAAAARPPALVLLAVEMPGMSGLEVMSRLQRNELDLPVVLIGNHASEADRVLGLELGADDYVAKPFSAREVGARVRSVRRSDRSKPEELVAGPLVIRINERRVLLRGRVVELTPPQLLQTVRSIGYRFDPSCVPEDRDSSESGGAVQFDFQHGLSV